jgi:hypothetical protein
MELVVRLQIKTGKMNIIVDSSAEMEHEGHGTRCREETGLRKMLQKLFSEGL